MITSLTLPLRTPFDLEQTEISDLDKVCFFFGPNGSGKTTISQAIADATPDGSAEVLHWDAGGPVKTYVYNRQFVKTNFANDAAVPGVFTMGKEAVDARAMVEQLNREIERERDKENRARQNLEQANDTFNKINDDIRDICWDIKGELPAVIKSSWNLARSKDGFRDRLLDRIDSLKPGDDTPDLCDLERRFAILYDDNAAEVGPLPSVDFEGLIALEGEPILQKRVIGKKDVPIGALIDRLGNSDWVAKGREYATEGNICPFCQKPTITDQLRADMEDFFDETYERDNEEIKRLAKQYADCADSITETLDGILKTHADYVDGPSLESRLADLKGIVKANESVTREKASEPSNPVRLESSRGVCFAISELLSSANDAIGEHNAMIRNRNERKTAATEELWRYVAIVAKSRIGTLLNSRDTIKKKIDGLSSTVADVAGSIEEKTGELKAAEMSLTNVRETAEAINDLLSRFGFGNFRLAMADGDMYRIERMDGTPVEDTLSEGESNFLTFLYFYYLMNGSQEATGTSEKRVVVIDDPVSSMDADSLFVASSLVRSLAREAREGEGKTLQLIVLTHNLSFYREVTHIRKKGGDPNTSYYLIRKDGGHSVIERHRENPVSGAYELLWKDFCRDDCSPLTACNTARRITETFFKFVGGIDADEVIADMPSPDREVAQSFMAWANAGSHIPFDDDTYYNTTESVDVYRRVLKTLFDGAGYGRHFDDMVSRFGKKED